MKIKHFSAILCVLVLAVLLWLPVEARAESNMTTSQAGVDFIKGYEGFAPKPIWDYGQWTVGYGTRCPDDKLAQYQAYGIPEEDAQQLLKDFLKVFEKSVNGFIDQYDLTMTQNQFDALISFSFNCGASWTLNPEGNLHRAVASGDMGNALIYGISLWSSAGGEYILVERRMSEANMYIHGEYKVNKFPDNFRWVFLDPNGGTIDYKIFGFDANTPQPLNIKFNYTPRDASGNTCIFGGWYTEDGKKVETLDSSLTARQVLRVKWVDKDGNEVEPVIGELEDNLRITVTGDQVNLRSGPGTHFGTVGKVDRGAVLTLTEVVSGGTYTWGKTDKGWIALEFTNYQTIKQGFWVLENGRWAFYKDGEKVCNTWQRDSKGWCYLGADGYMVTNSWVEDSVSWCYVGADGYCVTNAWRRDSKGWCYLDQNGRLAKNHWAKDSKGWCYVGADGYMVTNRWVKDSAGWCYVGDDGYCVINAWKQDSLGWCYLDENGRMMLGEWVHHENDWYYLDENGYRVTGWRLINGRNYYFLPSGIWDGK